jgi:asparagine synthase (glutamine-hydrolysing)
MSGICGFVTENGDRKQQENHILSMIDSLRFPEQPVGSGLCLGSVSLGAQGFSGRESGVARLSQNEQLVALAFHGNLYNLKELFNLKGNNTDLLKKLLNLFLKEGVPLLKKLRGEFVLAVWDGRDESLYLATDRFRVHQLFYYQDQEKFVFSSRMKGILACPFRVKRSINPEAIIHISGSSIIPTPDTIFNEVKKVPSSHLLTYRKGEVKLEPYWEISFLNPSKENESSLANRFRVIFEEAVTLSLEADGKRERTGAFLSGGVDSSTVTGVLAQLLGQ